MLAVVIVMSWRKRSGNGQVVQLLPPEHAGSAYHQWSAVLEEIQELRRELSNRDEDAARAQRRHEDAQRRRDEVLMESLEANRKELLRLRPPAA